MSLVVNADDFGKSEEVNRAITECFEKGYIDRTTIMVNMPYAEEAREISVAKGFDDKVGIHLNLTEGRPLTKGIASNPLFCDENGEFTASFYSNTLLRLHMDKNSVNDVYEELKAQINEYKRLGFTLNHIDSHHHVHTNWPIFIALKKLSREFDFESVRLSRNMYFGGNALMRVYKKYYNRNISKICKKVTNLFGSYNDAKGYLDTLKGNDQKQYTDLLSDLSMEVMVHPMYSEEGVLVDTDTPFEEEILLYEAIR